MSGIVVGPVVAALFITAWQILTEQRERGTGGHVGAMPVDGHVASPE